MHLLSFPRVYAVFFFTLISVSKTTFFNAHPPIIYQAYPALWDITRVGWRRDSRLRVPTQTPGWNLCHSGANHCTILPTMMKYLAQSDDDVHFFVQKFPCIGTVYIGSPPSQTSSSGENLTNDTPCIFILLSCASS